MRNFRGKRIDNGEWAEGAFATADSKAYILHGTLLGPTPDDGVVWSYNEVHPDSVGQQTGLYNTHAGDLIQIQDGDNGTAIGVVVWDGGTGQWKWSAVEIDNALTVYVGQKLELWKVMDAQYRYKGKVIGNKWDKEKTNGS